MVASGVEHRGKVYITKVAQTIVRGSTANEDTDFLANDGFFRDTGILQCLIGALKEDALLRV